MTTIDTAQFLADLRLKNGGHSPMGDDGMCVMEATAYIAGEPWSDHPTCVSRVLTDYCINLNDRWDDVARQRLVPFIPRLIGTRDDGLDETRGYLALDWLIRTFTPAWLDLAGLTAEAAELRALRRIADLAAAQAAGPVVKQAQTKAAAAGAAAGDAAGDAARAAAGDAAGDAAWAAAGDAARAVARDAARDALKPTVETLQASSLELLDQMIDGRWDA